MNGEVNFPNISEIINIVPIIKKEWSNGEEELRKIGEAVVRGFETDRLSRGKWERNVAESIKLFTAFMDEKNFPWPGCSNICLPLLTIATLQFQARAYDALIPPRGVVNTIATGDEDVPKAERVKKYMDYQLLYKMEQFEEGMEKTLIQLPLVGSVFRKTYFDMHKGMVVSDYISAQDLVVSYNCRTSIEDARRKTHVLYYTADEINERVARGVFDEAGWNLGPGSYHYTHMGEIRQMTDKVMGIEPSTEWEDNPRIILEQHTYWDLDKDGLAEPFVITVDYETQKVLRMVDRRFKDFLGRPITLEYFTHYTFIPNPEGFYGLGFGILLNRLNKAANDIVNEVIDAGTLANIQGGFVSRRSGIKRGNLTFQMGEYKEIDTFVDDISKAIFTFNFAGPNQTLYAVLGLLFEYSKLVASVSETMTGQLPASDTPATTVMALIEEGRKVFSTIHKRCHRSFKKELQKIFRLNSIYLDEIEYFAVLGETNLPTGEREMIGRADFQSHIDVIPVSDPNITSRAEKVLKAQQVFQTTLASPMTANNPQLIYNAQKRLYEALEVPNISEILQPPSPPEDLSPQEENAMALQEKPIYVLPEQDHMSHLSEHEAFLEGVYSKELSKHAKNILERHRKEHISYIYLEGARAQQMSNVRALEAMAKAGRIQ